YMRCRVVNQHPVQTALLPRPRITIRQNEVFLGAGPVEYCRLRRKTEANIMRKHFTRLTALFLAFLLLPAPNSATCGGGGGGGMGGMRGPGGPGGTGMGGDEQVYQVPWKLIKPEDSISAGLVVYWFPSSGEEFQKSSLRYSRSLSLYASQCITMGVADASTAMGRKFLNGEKLPVVVFAKADGTVINKLE